MDIVKVTFGIQDAKAQTGHVLYYTVLDPYFTVLGGQWMEALKAYYKELAKRLDAIITGRVASISISIDCELPAGIKSGPIAHSDVEEGAEFRYPESGGSAYFRHRIPTFDHSLFGFGQTTLDYAFSTPEVTAYTMLTFQSSDAPDWAEEYGVITDNRGDVVTAPPRIKKKFKASSS